MASLARLLEKPFFNLFLNHCHYHHRYLEGNDDQDDVSEDEFGGLVSGGLSCGIRVGHVLEVAQGRTILRHF